MAAKLRLSLNKSRIAVAEQTYCSVYVNRVAQASRRFAILRERDIPVDFSLSPSGSVSAVAQIRRLRAERLLDANARAGGRFALERAAFMRVYHASLTRGTYYEPSLRNMV